MWTRVAVQVVMCALASACVKIPAFDQRDGGTADGDAGDGGVVDPRVIVDTDATSLFAQGPGYLIRFSNDGSRMPYQFNVGTDLLLGGSQQCADENGMGIALFPVTRVNGVNTPGMGVPTVTTPLTGPHVGQVRIDWSTTVTCGTTSALDGDTTFSFFPDGRIVRFDRIGNLAELMVSNCTPCGPSASSFYLTSYTTLIADSNATLTDTNISALTSYGQEIDPGDATCLNERGHSIAFSWTPFVTTRVRVAAEMPTSQARTLAFIQDLHTNATLPQQMPYGWEATTQMKVSSDACGVVETSLTPFSADAQLVINGVPIGTALADGIYGGVPQTSGYPVDFPVTLTPNTTGPPSIPRGFAVWLYHAPLPATLTPVHSGNPTGTWYYEQRVGSNSVVFWFDVGLQAGETITINGS